MPNKLTQSRLRKVLKKTSAPQTGWLDVFPAVIGTASGVVSTGIPGIIYVRNFLNGQVLSVYNFVTPNTAGLQVEVGRKVETPGLWQVKGVREAYSVPAGGSVNAGSHTHDDLFVPVHRFLRFLALPINGGEFMVQIYGDVFRNAAGEVTSIVNQQVDLSSYVPATGAKWVVIHADSTGAISVTAGLEVDSKEILTLADIPDPVNGYVESCAVRLYAGQAQLYRDPNSINDFVDLRGLRANGVNLSLDDLTDVTASGANDGDVLTYDSFYDMWVPVAPTGGDVDSVNGKTGVVVLNQDDIGDGTAYKQYSATEKTKLAGIETGADVTDIANVGSSLNGASADTPLDADKWFFWDAVDAIMKYISWANFKAFLISAGIIREKLTANRTYYVRTDGSDSNNGLANTAGGAFLTPAKADEVVSLLDDGGYDIVVQLGDGTYPTGIPDLKGPAILKGTYTVKGNSTTPANVVISTTSADCFNASRPIKVTIKDMKLQTTTGGNCIISQHPAAFITYANINFGAAAAAHIRCDFGKIENIASNYTISGGAIYHWLAAVADGVIAIANITITLTGTPAFSGAFVLAQNGALSLYSPSTTFSGSATGKRYSATANGTINAFGGGATYIPGNVSGTTDGTGVYL